MKITITKKQLNKFGGSVEWAVTDEVLNNLDENTLNKYEDAEITGIEVKIFDANKNVIEVLEYEVEKEDVYKEEVIKRTLDVDVDGLKGTVKYTIKEMYDLIHPEGYATIKHRLIDEFTMTWDEIEEEERNEGKSMKEQIFEAYNIA